MVPESSWEKIVWEKTWCLWRFQIVTVRVMKAMTKTFFPQVPGLHLTSWVANIVLKPIIIWDYRESDTEDFCFGWHSVLILKSSVNCFSSWQSRSLHYLNSNLESFAIDFYTWWHLVQQASKNSWFGCFPLIELIIYTEEALWI